MRANRNQRKRDAKWRRVFRLWRIHPRPAPGECLASQVAPRSSGGVCEPAFACTFTKYKRYHTSCTQTGATAGRLLQRKRGRQMAPPFPLEQATGIEPAASAWEAEVLPLDYACEQPILYTMRGHLSMPPQANCKIFRRTLRQVLIPSRRTASAHKAAAPLGART